MTSLQEKVPPVAEKENGSNVRGKVSPSRRPDLSKEIRFRVSLPIVIPILALVGIGITVLLFGLFLLSIPKEHAPAVALALGLNILAAATFAASRPRMSVMTVVELCVLVIYPVLLAVILVNLGAVEPTAQTTAETAAAPAGAPEAVAAPVDIGAANLQFDTDELTFPAGEAVIVSLDNQDVAPHNLSIYKDDSLDKDLFIGENVPPGETSEFEVPELPSGAYYFRCDLHPTMDGRVTVE